MWSVVICVYASGFVATTAASMKKYSSTVQSASYFSKQENIDAFVAAGHWVPTRNSRNKNRCSVCNRRMDCERQFPEVPLICWHCAMAWIIFLGKLSTLILYHIVPSGLTSVHTYLARASRYTFQTMPSWLAPPGLESCSIRTRRSIFKELVKDWFNAWSTFRLAQTATLCPLTRSAPPACHLATLLTNVWVYEPTCYKRTSVWLAQVRRSCTGAFCLTRVCAAGRILPRFLIMCKKRNDYGRARPSIICWKHQVLFLKKPLAVLSCQS